MCEESTLYVHTNKCISLLIRLLSASCKLQLLSSFLPHFTHCPLLCTPTNAYKKHSPRSLISPRMRMNRLVAIQGRSCTCTHDVYIYIGPGEGASASFLSSSLLLPGLTIARPLSARRYHSASCRVQSPANQGVGSLEH